MKLVINFLLVLAVFGLFQATSAGVSGVSWDLIEKLKIIDDISQVPVLLAEEISEENHNADVAEEKSSLESPETPLEVKEDLPQYAIAAGNCSISIRSGLKDPQPVFLVTDTEAFYPYSDTGSMHVPAGQTLQMFCPGQFKSIGETLITATCVNGDTFRVNETSYKFSELVCKAWPNFVVKKTGLSCNGGTLLKVGFEVSARRFVQQMQICFNEEEEVTRYVNHTLQPGSNFYQSGVKRIDFQTGGFFAGKNVDKLYTQKSQLQVINADLGGEAEKYFNSSQNIFLARGHLGAKADFMYGSQQRATFLFVNVAPQWQVFNAGNWAKVEDGVRYWVSKNKRRVECYTGVHGVSTLPNKEGQETPLYLARDANNNGLIPVPKLYFRVVIEPATEKGIVFIGVNNPHLTLEQIQKDYILCNDISHKVSYIKWKRTNIGAGYSYACEVADFVKSVENLPRLSAKGGLLV